MMLQLKQNEEPARFATTNIKDMDLPALESWFENEGIKPFRARQVFHWLYHQHAEHFSEMTTLAQSLRQKLEQRFHFGSLQESACIKSVDSSRKYAFELSDQKRIESVLMPNRTQHTACISSQAGCAMGCSFCMTAKMGLLRNLTTGEMVEQVLHLTKQADKGKRISNVVFMGMGEPLHNMKNVAKAIRILTSDHGLGISARRITVSTCGLVSGMKHFIKEELGVNLAVSLNAVNDELRSELMPVNKRWNIEALLEACRQVPQGGRYRLTFEYILIAGLTDQLDQARLMVKRLHGLACKVNLIPYNAGKDSPYQQPTMQACRAFQKALLDKGLLATLRISKGQDIQAACGQLVNS